MTHDYTHCLNFRDDCPKECFRAKLVRDLDKRHLDRIGISWANLKGTEECLLKGEKKAYSVSDRDGSEGGSIIVFAETAGKAKAYAVRQDDFCDYGFTGIRAIRKPMLDKYYKGEPEMDWFDPKDRVAMVRYADFECSSKISFVDCECEECSAKKWCGRYEREMDDPWWKEGEEG